MPEVLDRIRNGVDSGQMYGTLDAIKDDPSLGIFQFRARNHWIDGAHNRSTMQGFDTGPNPAEHLLHALAACLTTSLVHVASARKVRLTEVESTLEGDMDVRGALGLSNQVSNGFTRIRVSFNVKGDAPAEKLREIVDHAQARSAVFDMVAHGGPVEVGVVTRSGTNQ